MRAIYFVVLSAIVYAATTMQPVCAQPAPATLTGRLVDPNGDAVSGLEEVSAQLTNVQTKETLTATVSPESGDFTVARAPPGTYDLRVPIACCLYSSFEQKGVVLAAGQTLDLALAVQWGMNLGTIGDDPGTLGNDMRARAGKLTGPVPRTADGKPDFSGVWSFIRRARPAAGEGPMGPQPKLKPWAADIQKQLTDLGVDRNAGVYCLPQVAIPTMLTYPQKFVQSTTTIVQLVEWYNPGYRQIFMDGRGHPEYWNPSWLGHSIGHWEGDTLVVETTGFNEITPMFSVHSEQLRVVERFRRLDYGRLEVEITAEDPDAWLEPVVTTMEAALVPEEEILEWVCAENNRDPVHGNLPWRGRP